MSKSNCSASGSRRESESGFDDVDLNQLTEMELDSLMAQLGSA